MKINKKYLLTRYFLEYKIELEFFFGIQIFCQEDTSGIIYHKKDAACKSKEKDAAWS
jgi:hypothetical protein